MCKYKQKCKRVLQTVNELKHTTDLVTKSLKDNRVYVSWWLSQRKVPQFLQSFVISWQKDTQVI